MLKAIQETAKSDDRLARLLADAREYVEVYLLARQRQKGCDGMGELATVKEECRGVVDKVIQYAQEKKYISQAAAYDIDSIADEILGERNTP